MRYLEFNVWQYQSRFSMNTDSMPVNHLATKQAGDGKQCRGQQRDIQSPWLKYTIGLVTQQPVKRGQSQRHHGHQSMDPSYGQITDSRHAQQIHQTSHSSQPASQTAQASQPQTNAYPERVFCIEIGQISTDQTKQESNRKMNHHRVNRMPANRHATNNRFLHHRYPPYLEPEALWKTVVRSLVPLGLINIFFFLGGCTGPQSALDPSGPSALAIADLWWWMFSFSAAILFTIVMLWLYAMWRKPPSMTETEAYQIGNRWIIGGGLVLPIVSLTLLLSFGIPIGYRLLPLPLEDQNPLRIEVTGQQWWWEIRYVDAGIVTKNQLHLPVNRPVDIHVSSIDVIHSFWVPKLGGKIDAIPGRTNVLRLEADTVGHFRGQCAEFCGKGHAEMILSIETHTPESFVAWMEGYKHE